MQNFYFEGSKRPLFAVLSFLNVLLGLVVASLIDDWKPDERERERDRETERERMTCSHRSDLKPGPLQRGSSFCSTN